MEERYLRNLGALTRAQCRQLRDKRVFIAGCGGLGGYLIELFLRLGVGGITACDPDVFEQSNLNRQLLSGPAELGRSKAETAAERARQVNPAVEFRGLTCRLTRENGTRLLAGHDLALDGLDNGAGRLALAEACAQLGIPLVHGAVEGWCAQVAVVPPGSDLLARLYPAGGRGAGDKSCLPFTPALCAALQAAEGVKLLCGMPATLEEKLLCADLLSQATDLIPL